MCHDVMLGVQDVYICIESIRSNKLPTPVENKPSLVLSSDYY